MGNAEKTMSDKDPTASKQAEAQFAAVLDEATKKIRDSSGETLKDFMSPPMKSLNELKTQLDKQNDQFDAYRDKQDTIYSGIAMVLRPVEALGDVLAGAASEVFAPTQTIFSAVTLLVNAANNVSSTYDSIIVLFNQLKDFTARLHIYVQSQMSDALRAKVIDILATLFEVLVLSTKEIRRGRFRAYFKNLIGADNPVQAALDKLNALTEGEEKHVISETYGSVAEIRTDLKEVSQSVQSLRSEQMERTILAHQDKLREILAPSPFPEDSYTFLNKSRVEGTGDWILMDEGFQSWLRGDMPYLLICGGPGTGKSFLSTRIIAWGAEHSSSFAYFYFRTNNPETRSVLQALRDVAYQLSEMDAYYGKQILKRVRSGDDIKTVASAFRRLFVQPFENDTRGKTLRILLDGVDEAVSSEMNLLFKQLSPSDNDKPTPVKSKIQLLLVGRPYISEAISTHVDTAVQPPLISTVHVTPDRNSADVKAFITEGVLHSRILTHSSNDFKQQVIDTMEKRVDGLFILAKFMLQEVNRKRRPSSILQSLQSYPKEINGMLKQTVSSLADALSEEDIEDLNEILTWVACAEQALTLEQLEAILIIRYGDPPFRFEESLRGQYSSFFELRREDGLTTDDLIKYYQQLRRKQKRDSGSGSGSRPRRSSSVGKQSPQRTLSPAQKIMNSRRRRTSPVALGTSPDRHFRPPSRSPARSPDLVDPDEELEFRSNSATTTINFFHASIREFFRDDDSTTTSDDSSGPSIGFEITAARTHVLKTCLKIFNDEKWFAKQKLSHRRQAIKQYAAWYWQEHLDELDPQMVDKEDKRTIGQYLYKMLADEQTIYEWSIIYEENDEGLDVMTDENMSALRKWMSDADVQEGLDKDARDWVTKAVNSPTGVVQKIGRFYARAWVDESLERYVPTKFCFKIVQSIAFMDAGKSWSDSTCHWTEIPVKERIEKALEWASFDKTAHWFRRVGSTYLVSDMNSEALRHYDEARKIDGNSVETLGRMAYCLTREKRYREALELTLKCVDIEEKTISEKSAPERQLAQSRWRLYKDHVLIGQCYYRLGQVDDSIKYFQMAIISAGDAGLEHSERFEPVIAFLGVLASENRHEEVMKLVQDMSLHPAGPKEEKSRLIDFMLEHFNKPLILEWIPKSASKDGQTDFLLERLEMAVGIAHDSRDHLKVLYLRLAIGTTLIYSRRVNEACELLDKISFIEYRPRGNVPTRQAYSLSFQKLAGLYKDRALHSGIKGHEFQDYMSKIEDVWRAQSAHHNLDMPVNMLGSDVNIAAIYLGLFHRLRGETKQADEILGELILESCEILEDEDAQNDEYALENLLKLFVAADAVDDARALAVSMRRLNPDLEAETPIDSPIRRRGTNGQPIVAQPKLPDIQSANRSCAQCLDIIDPAEEFSMCRMCIESFCRKCMAEVIKQPGNKTEGGSTGDEVVCRADHDWITMPPLGVLLHRGELWLGDGSDANGDGKRKGVVGFVKWKDEVKERWRGRTPTRKW